MSTQAGGGCAAVFGLAVMVGVVWLWFVDSEAGSAAAILLVALVVWAQLFGPKDCQVCQAPIKRKAHRVVVDGKSLRACPSCNSRIARKQSRQAVDRLLGG